MTDICFVGFTGMDVLVYNRGALVVQWLALLPAVLEVPGSIPALALEGSKAASGFPYHLITFINWLS